MQTPCPTISAHRLTEFTVKANSAGSNKAWRASILAALVEAYQAGEQDAMKALARPENEGLLHEQD
jgi:hypothetical protein